MTRLEERLQEADLLRLLDAGAVAGLVGLENT